MTKRRKYKKMGDYYARTLNRRGIKRKSPYVSLPKEFIAEGGTIPLEWLEVALKPKVRT
jgi:hypothetical protein